MSMRCVVGPTHPFRGGIPRHTTLMAEAIATRADIRLITFTRQYPGWLYKGARDRDPDQIAPAGFVPDRRLDSLSPLSWRSTARVIGRMEPDVVVAVWWHPFFAPKFGTLLRHVRRRSPRTVRVVVCHNVLLHESSPVDRTPARRALRVADGLVVHAASQRDVANDLLLPVPVLVTPHPAYEVDVNRLHSRPRHGAVNLLFFGLVRRYKGVDVLFRALSVVLTRRKVRLVVAGEFWDPVQPYTALVDELGIGDHVEILPGYVSDADLTKLLAAADLMVAPY